MIRFATIDTNEIFKYIYNVLVTSGIDTTSASEATQRLIHTYIEVWFYNLVNLDEQTSIIHQFDLTSFADKYARHGDYVVFEITDYMMGSPPWKGNSMFANLDDDVLEQIVTFLRRVECQLNLVIDSVDDQHHVLTNAVYKFERWVNLDIRITVDIED
jgi:hypothetical protein